jgi:hypothetical protein
MEDGGMAVNEISESRDKRPETRAKIAENTGWSHLDGPFRRIACVDTSPE